MIVQDEVPTDGSSNRLALLRWFVSCATLSVPQAAGPVAFSLVALSLTGETKGGAAMILAMTIAQVVGAIPLTRLGKKLSSATVLRLLITFRTMALACIVLCAAFGAPFLWLIVFAAFAGAVNGAAYGYLRSVLNRFAHVSRLPRALGIAATLNEVTFVLAPVAAAGLGSISPIFALLALTILGALPAVFVPHTGSSHIEDLHSGGGSVLSPAIILWLMCAAGGGAAVAAIEIGAVAMALNFGYKPSLAIMFTVPLCLASVAGGIWISVLNRMATRRAVVCQLSLMTLGAAMAALGHSLTLTIVGAVFIGFVLAPLATHYSLSLDKLAPPHRRPEVFALLRTANAVGVIVASAALTVVSLSVALVLVTGLMFAVTLVVATASLWPQARNA
ncbi:MFS transporter [Rhizobiaceae bacterium n13]|uniref:MFS transporter n=1 Tax=Ferirhizobium litorale TaxID=2927786 RepID=A0AAE3QGK5_9HYPH|nr:MFS transporter [Fererhizobium litorale]MDI7861924.1 MFS transporter [Fererhizobium litorale]MDI7922804.1 MFS transporter [Fererhizobium litorale]